jgi:hypothetical protein
VEVRAAAGAAVSDLDDGRRVGAGPRGVAAPVARDLEAPPAALSGAVPVPYPGLCHCCHVPVRPLRLAQEPAPAKNSSRK